jgi:DNA-binding NtrC family response regulator
MTDSTPADRDRILVVDDEEAMRQLLERTLTRTGYEVVCAVDGEQGLALAIELQPSVVISDIRMAGLDGHTLLRRIVAQGLDAGVVIMSAHGDMQDVVDALRNGAVDFLEKPWAPADLLSAVARAAEAHDHRRSTRQLKALVAAGTPARPEPGTTHLQPLPVNLMAFLEDLEDQYIASALSTTQGNKKAAADLLGMGRTTLTEKLRRKRERLPV